MGGNIRMIRPLALVAEKNVGFFTHDTTDEDWEELLRENPTWAKRLAFALRLEDSYGDPLDAYQIHAMLPNLHGLYDATGLDPDLFQAYLNGVVVHEVAHLLFDTLLFAPGGMEDNAILKHVWNVCVDVHDEYWMAYFHPGYAPYIQFALSLMQHTTPAEEATDLFADLQTFFFLARFGTLPPAYDKAFVDFLLPLVRSITMVKDQTNVIDCVHLIYGYLEAKYAIQGSKQDKQDWDKAKANQDASDAEGGLDKKTVDALGQGQQVLDNAVGDMLQTIKDMQQGNKSQKQKSQEKMAGLNDAPILFNEADAAFVRKVITEYPDKIEQIRAAFMQLWDAPDMVASTDGDMNMLMQQELYVGSFTHEETQSYLLPLNVMPSISLVVDRDISESTEEIMTEFAIACILFLAALSDIEGVEIAEIDFDDCALQKLFFGQNVESLAVAPQWEGGTSLDEVIPILKNLQYREAVRLHFVLTDGYIGNWNWAKDELQKLEETHGLITFIVEVVKSGTGNLGYAKDWPRSFSSTLNDLPDKLLTHVIEEVKRLRGGYQYAN